MKKMLRKATTITALLFVPFMSAWGEEPTNAAALLKSPITLTPQEMKWEDCSAVLPPGAKCITIQGDRNAPNVLFTYRLKMPDNYKIPPHSHPADEHLTVIAGTLNIGFGDKLDVNATRSMAAGSFIVVPKGTHHFVWTRGETSVQVHAIGPWGLTYVNPEDNPRKR